ncbi:hypothetical protein F2Q69_00025489 [Brassica cretica]|uniref:Uncharacterized protein n=1 Tax=Brassica cretica TaxID=69181 RepID=A0A8S9QK36_BRACR|nr:hypothetical protein F2Q69_00025489 [Brassica cretica]
MSRPFTLLCILENISEKGLVVVNLNKLKVCFNGSLLVAVVAVRGMALVESVNVFDVVVSTRSEVLKSKRFSIWSGLYGGLGWFGRSPSPVKIKGLCSPGVILSAASNCLSSGSDMRLSVLRITSVLASKDLKLLRFQLFPHSLYARSKWVLFVLRYGWSQWKCRLNAVQALRSLPTWFLVLWIGNIFKSTNKLP